MNRPTNRIQELQQHQPLGFFARWGLRAAALSPLGGAWEVGPWRAQLGCGHCHVGCPGGMIFVLIMLGGNRWCRLYRRRTGVTGTRSR